MGIGLCACFTRGLAEHHVYCPISVRSDYLSIVLSLVYFQSNRAFKVLIISQQYYIVISFVCCFYGSIYLVSSLSLVSLCGLSFLVSSFIISAFDQAAEYLFESIKTDLLNNANDMSNKLGAAIMRGLNVTYLIHL